MKGQFLKVGIRRNPFWVFWVLGKDHLPKFLEFSEQFSVGKSEVEVRQQCSLGAAVAEFPKSVQSLRRDHFLASGVTFFSPEIV